MTTPTSGYSENELVEQPAIELLEELGWEYFNAYAEFDHCTCVETIADQIVNDMLSCGNDAFLKATEQNIIKRFTTELARCSCTALLGSG